MVGTAKSVNDKTGDWYKSIFPFCVDQMFVGEVVFDQKTRAPPKRIQKPVLKSQGTLTEGENSVQLTSLLRKLV
jgi:hypothetical protein